MRAHSWRAASRGVMTPKKSEPEREERSEGSLTKTMLEKAGEGGGAVLEALIMRVAGREGFSQLLRRVRIIWVAVGKGLQRVEERMLRITAAAELESSEGAKSEGLVSIQSLRKARMRTCTGCWLGASASRAPWPMGAARQKRMKTR